MSALGHKRTFAVQNGMSALPPKADIRRHIVMSALCQKRTSQARRSWRLNQPVDNRRNPRPSKPTHEKQDDDDDQDDANDTYATVTKAVAVATEAAAEATKQENDEDDNEDKS